MHILVLGASGGCGRLFVEMAVAAGHQVTAAVRPSSGYTPPPGVRVEEGDVLDPAFFDRALPGHEVVVSGLGIKRVNAKNPWSPLASPPDFSERSMRLLVEAMKRHGLRRVLAISAAGVGDSAARMNLLMKFMVAKSNVGVAYRDLARMEEVLARSGLDWMAPRPTRLTDGPKTGRIRTLEGFPMNAAISRADVAAFLLERVVAGPLEPRTPIISVTG
jgi:uncharacterized protein YbjT (DUF2867 family)